MLHIAFRIASSLFFAWIGLCALFFVGLGLAILIGELPVSKNAQDILDEANQHYPYRTKGRRSSFI
jgi:hypothetical protein